MYLDEGDRSMRSHRLLWMDDLSDSADAAAGAARTKVAAFGSSSAVCFFFFLQIN